MQNEKSKDDFWDIEKLIPAKKSSSSVFSTRAKSAEVILESHGNDNSSENRKINFGLYATASVGERREKIYFPQKNRLIQSVKIIPCIDKYDFYDTFRKGALIYFDYNVPKCDFVPFYSFKPQYSQMNTEQKRYYFYWRGQLRRGNYLKSDYSYIYLFAYEVLNLPDKISREDGLRLLCSVWREYRRELPRLDASFSLWIQDYCLMYELPCPYELLGGMLFDATVSADFKEFYLADIEKGSGGAVSAMIGYLSDYDWRKTKYATGDFAADYRRHVESAMARVFSYMLKASDMTLLETRRLKRHAFSGSLCSHSVKSMLEIEYYPIATSDRLRAITTAALKYTENKLRALLGVKSRLAVKDLPEEYRAILEAYFFSFEEEKRIRKIRENTPEYEKLYDAPDAELSFENADEIERASWSVTARLTDGESECESTEELTVPETKAVFNAKPDFDAEPVEDTRNADVWGLSAEEIRFLSLLAEGKESFAKAYAEEAGLDGGCLFEKINDAFSDNFGDVILEPTDSYYKVIDDYYGEIKEWISKIPI